FRLVFALAGGNAAQLKDAARFYLGQSLGFYEPHAYVGYRLTKRCEPHLRDDGFTSVRDVPKARTEPTIRIAFLGASTTQGSADLGYLGSFPYLVERLLRRAHLSAETLNCGTPAWTSVENLVHFELNVQDYQPDWVVIHQGANDVQACLYREF